MLIAALSTGNKIGLGLVGLAFVVFALLVSMVIPRYRPDFPAKRLGLFVWISVAFFVAMMSAVIVFGKESEKASAEHPTPTGTAPTSTAPSTTTAPTTTEAAPSAADVAKGKGLYTSLGCIGCHTLDGSASAGPTWKGLYGSQVTLADGSMVTADEAYLKRSIQDPDADIVKGFQPGVMSATIQKGLVSDSDAAALIAYIQSVK